MRENGLYQTSDKRPRYNVFIKLKHVRTYNNNCTKKSEN